MKFIKKIDFFRITNYQYLIVIFIIFVTFLINKGIFIKESIIVEHCSNGRCEAIKTEFPELNDKSPSYFLDEILKKDDIGFYRITFKIKSTKKTSISMSLSNYSDDELEIKKISAEKENFYYYETNFYSPGNFTNILFEKENMNDNAEVFIKEIRISKLNIYNESDLSKLKKTLIGETSFSLNIPQQTQDYFYKLPWMKEIKTSLGQIFRAESDYISGISFKIDITKEIQPSSKQYLLTIRKINYDGRSAKNMGDSIASLKFSIASDIEKYRQYDGSLLFPIYGHLERGSHYFISIDNSGVEVDDFNFLTFRGSKDENAYPDGSAAMKKGKEVYKIDGDLYFIVHGADFNNFENERILSGAKIEDLGRGIGKYFYNTKGLPSDALDLDENSSDVYFDEGKKVLLSNTRLENEIIYKFATIHPIKNFTFKGQQIKPGWNRIKVFYSFDRKKWNEIPYSEEKEELLGSTSDSENNSSSSEEDNSDDDTAQNPENLKSQVFNFTQQLDKKSNSNVVYIKITYDRESSSKSKYFGIKNLSFSADLNIK